MAVFAFANAKGCLLGGFLGDFAAKLSPNHGRIIIAQVIMLPGGRALACKSWFSSDNVPVLSPQHKGKWTTCRGNFGKEKQTGGGAVRRCRASRLQGQPGQRASLHYSSTDDHFAFALSGFD